MVRFDWVREDLKKVIVEDYKNCSYLAPNAFLVVVFDNNLMPTIRDAVAEEGVSIYDEMGTEYPLGMTYDGNLYYGCGSEDDIIVNGMEVNCAVMREYGRLFLDINREAVADPFDLKFEEQHQKVVEEMRKLSEIWVEYKVKNYPKYLPSFDEHVEDIAGMLEAPDTEICKYWPDMEEAFLTCGGRCDAHAEIGGDIACTVRERVRCPAAKEADKRPRR